MRTTRIENRNGQEVGQHTEPQHWTSANDLREIELKPGTIVPTRKGQQATTSASQSPTEPDEITPHNAYDHNPSEWEHRRWIWMRGARVCRRQMRNAEAAGLPDAAAYYRRHVERDVQEARTANRAVLWHRRNQD